MKAKDTVRLCPSTPSGWRINCDSKCHKAQAEISFKAGIREVVEYKCEHCSTPNFIHLVVPIKKLKEWGI